MEYQQQGQFPPASGINPAFTTSRNHQVNSGPWAAFNAGTPGPPYQGGWFPSVQQQPQQNPYQQTGLFPFIPSNQVPNSPHGHIFLQMQIPKIGNCPLCREGFLHDECTGMSWTLLVLGLFLIFPLFCMVCFIRRRCDQCDTQFTLNNNRVN